MVSLDLRTIAGDGIPMPPCFRVQVPCFMAMGLNGLAKIAAQIRVAQAVLTKLKVSRSLDGSSSRQLTTLNSHFLLLANP